jgi:Fe2+ transport system protein B
MRCQTPCDKCPSAAPATRRLGLDFSHYDYVVALAGNPNTGKSTVFNALTGLKQHTGNWPGKTIARAEGAFAHADRRYKLIDLPGTYSLLSASTDEEVARDFILFGRPDCTVVVVDATSLERNLNLALQVMEITPRTVVCVNLLDEARRKGVRIDLERLTERLGVPAVGTAARSGEGLPNLVATIADVVTGQRTTHPQLPPTPPELRAAIDELVPLVETLAPGLPSARWVAYRLLEGDDHIRRALESGELATLAAALQSTPDRESA